MEIKEVIITPYARQTLLFIFEFIKEESSTLTAIKFKDDFLNVAEQLDKNYLIYPECRFLQTKKEIYRNIIWNKYLIIYKIMKDEIWIIGLFHTSQSPNKLKAFRKIRK